MRIPTLLQKINDLAAKPEQRTAIDVDLMLDYTRVLYADLLDWREKLVETSSPPAPVQTVTQPPKPPVQVYAQPVIKEPTLAEIAEAMEREAELEDEEEEKPVLAVVAKQIPEPEDVPKPVIAEPARQAIPAANALGSGNAARREGRDIRSMISINDKYQIMSELFGNDKKAYEQALDYVNQSKSESAAMQWLREQLWITEDHSDAALSFYDIVSRYFKV
jgi:hypothetical protein